MKEKEPEKKQEKGYDDSFWVMRRALTGASRKIRALPRRRFR